MKLLTKALLAASVAIATTPAQAALLQFDVTGSQTASFTIDSSPTPPEFDSQLSFTVFDVQGTVNAGSIDRVTFYTAANLGGFVFIGQDPSDFINTIGAQVFSGTVDAPVFTPGTFSFKDPSFSYTLTISEVSAPAVPEPATDVSAPAVPEPATWAMMLIGFGMVGAASRFRRRMVTVSLA